METTRVQTVLPRAIAVSDEILNLSCCKPTAPSEGEPAGDPKLTYLWEKCGRE